MNVLPSPIGIVATKRVSFSLDEQIYADLKEQVGRGGMSAFVNEALAHALRMRAIDQYLNEAEERAGPIPPEMRERAEKLFSGEADT